MNNKKTIIPAGYRVSTKTWENDGDNYKTLVKEGLSKRQVEFLAKIVKLSKSIGLENEYEPDEEVYIEAYARLLPIFEEFPDVFSEAKLLAYREEGGCMIDYLIDNLYSRSDNDYALRVIESFKVEYIANPIEMEDVTEEFTK
jgi:hypothetical protein